MPWLSHPHGCFGHVLNPPPRRGRASPRESYSRSPPRKHSGYPHSADRALANANAGDLHRRGHDRHQRYDMARRADDPGSVARQDGDDAHHRYASRRGPGYDTGQRASSQLCNDTDGWRRQHRLPDHTREHGGARAEPGSRGSQSYSNHHRHSPSPSAGELRSPHGDQPQYSQHSQHTARGSSDATRPSHGHDHARHPDPDRGRDPDPDPDPNSRDHGRDREPRQMGGERWGERRKVAPPAQEAEPSRHPSDGSQASNGSPHDAAPDLTGAPEAARQHESLAEGVVPDPPTRGGRAGYTVDRSDTYLTTLAPRSNVTVLPDPDWSGHIPAVKFQSRVRTGGPATCVGHSSHGRRAPSLAVGSDRAVFVHTLGTERPFRFKYTSNGPDVASYVRSVVFSNTGSQLLAAGEDGTVQLWSLAQRERMHTFTGHASDVNSVAFSPVDSCTFASGSSDGTARLWDLNTGKWTRKLVSDQSRGNDPGTEGTVTCVGYSPDGRVVGVGNMDESLSLFDSRSNDCIARHEGHRDGVYGLSFSPCGQTIAVTSLGGGVSLWDLAMNGSGARLNTNFRAHEGEAWCCAFSPDGNWLLSGGGDNTILVHDARLLRTPFCLAGFESAVIGLSYSGKALVTTSGQAEANVFEFCLD